MSSIYNIRYGRTDGTLACLVILSRASDEAAVKLAHSLNDPSYADVEVWRGCEKVHSALLAPALETA